MLAEPERRASGSTAGDTCAASPNSPPRRQSAGRKSNIALPRPSFAPSSPKKAARGPSTLSPEQELEVIKAVLLREGYLVRLRQLMEKANAAKEQALQDGIAQGRHEDVFLTMPLEMVDLLELLRTSTVEVVEAIRRWKLAKRDVRSEYLWNRHNYLTRLPTDLDFLQGFRPLMDWLGFDVARNPFLLPQPLLGLQAPAMGERDKVVIGTYAPAFLRIERPKPKPPKREPSPYLTPIINDLDFLPAPKVKPAASTATPANATAPTHPPTRAASRGEEELHPATILLPDDVARIRKAEQAILDEEKGFGTYVRGEDGVLVLQRDGAASAREGPSARRRSRGSSVIVGQTASTGADTRRSLARVKEEGEEEEGEEGPCTMALDDSHYNGRPLDDDRPLDGGATLHYTEAADGFLDKRGRYHTPRLPMDAPDDPAAIKRAHKMGSDLFLLTVAGTSGRMKPLARPNRLLRRGVEIAYLEAEARQKREAADLLERRVKGLQAQLFPPRVKERREAEEERSGDTDDEDEEAGQHTSIASIRGRLRRECGSVWREIELLRHQALELEREQGFKQQCQAYLQQVAAVEKRLELQRRRLRDGEVLPEDEGVAMSLEDAAATKVQAIVRGGLVVRPQVSRFRQTTHCAAVRLQALWRGVYTRMAYDYHARRRRAAIDIQRTWRGSRVKNLLGSMRHTSVRAANVVPIQAFVRRVLGRRRAARRQAFMSAAHAANDAVNHRGLLPEDLSELGERLLRTLLDPSRPFPPPALLGLLRLLALLLGRPTSPDTASHYDLLGAKSTLILTSAELTWSNAMRLLYRSKRLLRKLRCLALDPLRNPPRILHFPPACLALSSELRKDPAFSEASMAGLGQGSRAAVGLFRYYTNLEAVLQVQHHFTPSPQDCVPAWLHRFRNLQQRRRRGHLQALARRAALARAEKAVKDRIAAGLHFRLEQSVVTAEKVGLSLCEDKVLHHIDAQLCQLTERLQERGEALTAKLEGERRRLARAYNIAHQEREVAEGDARAGVARARARLRGLRQDEYRAEEALRGKEIELQIGEAANALRFQLAQFGHGSYPEEMGTDAAAMGQVQARLQLAERQRDAYVATVGGKYYIPALEGLALQNYTWLQARVLELGQQALEIMEGLQDRASEYEDMIHEKDVSAIMEDIRTQRWDSPTEAQREQEAAEDEKRAREESVAMSEFLPTHVAEQLREDYLGPEGKVRKSAPLIIALARDAPRRVKQGVYSFLDTQFPDMFVRLGPQVVPVERNKEEDGWGKQGPPTPTKAEACPFLDARPFHDAFVGGRHVIAEFDVGCGYATRRAFLAAMFSLKGGLDPIPRCLLITGGREDRQGLGSDWEERTLLSDLGTLRDGDLKGQIQLMNEYLHQLTCGPALADLESFLQADHPPLNRRLPPVAYVLVMRVLVILLCPLVKPKGPLASSDALIWQAARLLLRERRDLANRLHKLQFATIDPETFAVLEEHLNSPHWPQRCQLSLEDDPLLTCLSQWALLSLRHAKRLQAHRGEAEPFASRFRSDTFEYVVAIGSGVPLTPDVRLSTSKMSAASIANGLPLHEALPLLARLVASSSRVHVDVVKMVGDTRNRVVQCFQFKSRVLLTLYDPETCERHDAYVHTSRLGKLLEPNFTDVDRFNIKSPPQSLPDLYRQLVKLLKFETDWVDGEGVQRLVCERPSQPLQTCTRRINGHVVQLTAFEDARGELGFHMTVPQLGPQVCKCYVDFAQLTRLYYTGDPLLEKPFIQRLGEGSLASGDDEEDAGSGSGSASAGGSGAGGHSMADVGSSIEAIVHPIMERLSIRPTALTAANAPPDTPTSRIGLEEGVPVPPLLQARLRAGGGPGRLLFRRVHRVRLLQHHSPAHHMERKEGGEEAPCLLIVSVMECGGHGGLLRIKAYDVATAAMAEFRVSAAERALLLPTVGEGYITYHETDEARAFTRAALRRLLLVSEPTPPPPTADPEEAQSSRREVKGEKREKREIQWDVSVHCSERILPGVGTACLGVGLDVRGHSLTWRLSLPTLGLHVAHAEPLAHLAHVTAALMERAGGMVEADVSGLEGRYLSDAKLRGSLWEWAEAAVQVRDFDAQGGGRVQAVGLALQLLPWEMSVETADDVAATETEGQGRWVTLATEPRLHPSLLEGHGPTDSPTTADGGDVAGGSGPMQATAGWREGLALVTAPRLIRSLWEKRLVERMMTKMPVIEDFSLLQEDGEGQQVEVEAPGSGQEEEGEDNPQDGEGDSVEAGGSTQGPQVTSQPSTQPGSSSSLSSGGTQSRAPSGRAPSAMATSSSLGGGRLEEVEVRAWESYSGGSGPPHRVYRLMVIDRTRGGLATLTIDASTRMHQIVGEEMAHLLDPRRQKSLLRFLLEQRLRLYVLHLGYQSNFTLRLCNIPPTRIPTPPPPPSPPEPAPSPFLLSGCGVTLLCAETRCISGVRCRLLTYALGLPNQKRKKKSHVTKAVREGTEEGREPELDNMSAVTWEGRRTEEAGGGQEGYEHDCGGSVGEGSRGRAGRGREEASGEGYEVFKHEAPNEAQQGRCRQAMEFAYHEDEQQEGEEEEEEGQGEVEVAYVAVLLLNPVAAVLGPSDFAASSASSTGGLNPEPTANPNPAGVRAHLRLPLAPLVKPLRVNVAEVARDRLALREVLRNLAGFLRFRYDGPEGAPSLTLPYCDLRLQPRGAY